MTLAPFPALTAANRPESGQTRELTAGSDGSVSQRGRSLFSKNCAHCHGEDAKGDEGPDLHALSLSDDRIEKKIVNGIKGEMPAFKEKFRHEDIKALIAFLRTLK
jgi:mono/diheme cytochrome c family protein